MNPLISIVVPSFNQGRYIEQTITSVLGQNYSNFELIVIDGGSTDQTLEIIDRYARSISYFVSEPDRGQADAINKGFREAKGDILAWLNSDDMYLPCTLSKIANVFGKSTEPKLVYGGCLHFREKKSEAHGVMPIDFDEELLTYYDYIIQPSTFWTRSLWEKAGELNEFYHYVLDWDWFIRASKICKFTAIQEYLSIYRLHEEHKTGTGGDRRAKEIVKVVENYANEEWKAAYQEIEKSSMSLKEVMKKLSKFRLYRSRILFHPHIYFKYGCDRVDTVLSMI